MEVEYKNERLKKVLDSDKKLRTTYGHEMAKKIKLRLDQLRNADTLADMGHWPGARFPGARSHPLGREYEGCHAVDLVHPKRLIFEPADDPLPLDANGKVDIEKVTRIRILGIEDYH